MGTLYYGDNLNILRDNLHDDSVDLIYLDPPFNSKRDYNLLFKNPKGHTSDAQITAFEDTWHWGEQAEREFTELLHQPNTNVAEMIQSLRRFLRENDVMAYLTMMATRLLEMHRVLKPTGSLYLHCDSTASHYLRIVLDAIFDTNNFRNEIIWKRTNSHNDAKRFADIHDCIYYYSKSPTALWNPQYLPHGEKYLSSHYNRTDSQGRVYRLDNIIRSASMGERPNLAYEYKDFTPKWGWRVSRAKLEELDRNGKIEWAKSGTPYLIRYLDEQKGILMPTIWDDISPINSQAAERLGYPTQKPLALLERILQASSNPGDTILDPFCGCGTAVHAAQKLGREWIGIDITHLAISLIEKRMKDAFPGITFEVLGTPKDLDGARDLAFRDKYQFQWWACTLVNAQPYQGKKKGADTGIDGLIYFQDDPKEVKKIILSVKGGEHVTRTMIADLKNTVEREKAQIGLFVTLAHPTQPMIAEATSAGYYESPLYGAFPKIQILTIEGLLNGTEKAKYPDLSMGGLSFKKAKVEKEQARQSKLGL